MDVQPIAVKEEGEIGHGITRELKGVVMVLTGTDANGVQIGEFGSSEGELERNIMLGDVLVLQIKEKSSLKVK